MDFLKMKNEQRNAAIKALEEVVAKRDAKQAELDAFAGTLDTEKRSASADEDVLVSLAFDEFRSLKAEAVAGQAAIDALEVEIAELDTVASARANVPAQVRGSGRGAVADAYDIELRSAPRTEEVRRDIEVRAMRAIEGDERLSDEQRHHLDGLMRNTSINKQGALARHVIATGRPAYRSAFAKLVRQNIPAHLTDAEYAAVEEVRAINITTNGDGGFLMPFTLDPTINLIGGGRVNPMRQLATVRTVVTDNWQGVNTTGVTSSWDAESAVVSDDSPTFTQPAIGVHSGKTFVPYTMESEDDFDGLAADMSEIIMDSLDDLESTGFTTGTGTGQPQGIVTGLVAGGAIVTSAGTDAYAVADVYALQNALDSRYESNPTWQMNKSVINLTRQFGAAVGHAFLTDLGGGQPSELLGDPLYKNSALDGVINATADNYVGVYGDVRRTYRIHDRLGVRIEVVQHLVDPTTARPTGERGWYARKRVGGGVVDTNAANVLNVT